MRRPSASAQLTLPSDPRLRRVLLAYGLSRFTEYAGWLAILLVAYEQGGASLAGGAAFAMQVPAIVLVPVFAGLADRVPRGRALTVTYLGVIVFAALTGLALFAHAPLWIVLVAGAVTEVAVCLARPMHFATLPLLSRGPGDLVAANGWSSFMDGVAIFIGFALAGVITDTLGAWVVMAVAAVLCAIAAALTRGLDIPVAALADGDGAGEIRAALEGLRALRRSIGAMALLALMASTSVIMGSNETLAVAFNDEVLHKPESTAGLVAGAFGLGIAVGGIAIQGVARRPALAPVVLAGALVLGISELAVSFLGALAPVVIAMILVGIGMAMVLVAARTLLQRSMDDDVLARVLAIQEGVHLSGLATGYVLGPLVILAVGAKYSFVPMGALVLGIAVLAYRWIRSLDAVARVAEREVALLVRVPFLAGLPPYELERLAQGATWADVPAGTVVVRQGDDGDSYYLVESGELAVTVDGAERPEPMVAGEGFGEIALLHRVPRTATVTARTDSRLLVVGMADFLAAVTSSPDGAQQAREVSRARLAADKR